MIFNFGFYCVEGSYYFSFFYAKVTDEVVTCENTSGKFLVIFCTPMKCVALNT